MLQIGEEVKIHENITMVISDCINAEIVCLKEDSRFSKNDGTTILLNDGIRSNYDIDAYLGKFESKFIYAAKTKRKNKRGEPVFALYAKDYHENAYEIVEGIVHLKVEELTNQSNHHGLRIDITVQDIEITSLKRTWVEEIWFR